MLAVARSAERVVRLPKTETRAGEEVTNGACESSEWGKSVTRTQRSYITTDILDVVEQSLQHCTQSAIAISGLRCSVECAPDSSVSVCSRCENTAKGHIKLDWF